MRERARFEELMMVLYTGFLATLLFVMSGLSALTAIIFGIQITRKGNVQ